MGYAKKHIRLDQEIRRYQFPARGTGWRGDTDNRYLFKSTLAEDGSIRDKLSVDVLHLSGPGYQLWQSPLEPHLASIVR